MKLNDILRGFETAKEQLKTFIDDQSTENEVTREVLHKGEADVKKASTALKQIIKVVGK